MTNYIYVTHLFLDKAAKAALVAHFTEGFARECQLKEVRAELIAALSRCAAGDQRNSEALLKDKISNAILDSVDYDWNSDMGADAVMKALFDFHEGEDQ